jgi:hypothetical protein
MTRFWAAFGAALVATLALFAVTGWSISSFVASRPPDKVRTPAFEMSLADGWSCDLDGTEWVCDPPGDPPRDAIAVMAIKYRNKDDTLEAYEAHLRQPQLVESKDGTVTSTVEEVGRRQIGGREWVESLHLSSELKGYVTYYAATITSHLGVLVTLSAEETVIDKRRRELEQMMNSLVIYQRGMAQTPAR